MGKGKNNFCYGTVKTKDGKIILVDNPGYNVLSDNRFEGIEIPAKDNIIIFKDGKLVRIAPDITDVAITDKRKQKEFKKLLSKEQDRIQ